MEATQPPIPAIKPLRRSVTFWLGLITLSFLLWIWADSFFHRTWISLVRISEDPVEIFIHPGRSSMEWTEGAWLGAPRPVLGRFGMQRLPQKSGPKDLWLPQLYKWSDGQRFFPAAGSGWTPGSPIPPGTPSAPVRIHQVQVALWMPPAAFLLIWMPVLMLGRRRQGRIAAKLASIPEPAPTN